MTKNKKVSLTVEIKSDGSEQRCTITGATDLDSCVPEMLYTSIVNFFISTRQVSERIGRIQVDRAVGVGSSHRK